ncbi:MAG: acyltransferase [Bacteroidales bacterium]|jgi:peptidoglycan/LPS O-acetylase OafA/YrhL|nr:acyltransferase [Bacteroidales bacterium]
MRNEKLDIFRGLAMIWVILVHCLYWLGYFSWHKSFLLIEMPLFFFIAGASNGMASKKSLGVFYLTRFKRILMPYWIYGIICVALISIVSTPETIKSFIKLAYSWVNPFASTLSSITYLTWAIWFIPVYLLVILAFPLFEKIRNIQYMRYFPLFLLLLLIGILNFFENGGTVLYYAKMFVCYGFFTYLGLFFTEITKERKIFPAFAIVAICLLTMFVLVKFFGQSLNMQNNKFPPNFMFFSFSLAALTIFYIFSDIIVNAIKFLSRNKIFDWIYIQYGFTIFLFHPFVFLLLGYLKKNYFAGVNSKISFIIIFLLAILLSAVIGKMFSWVERKNIFSINEKKKNKARETS